MKGSFCGARGAVSVQVSSLPEGTVFPEQRLEVSFFVTAPISTVAGVVCGQCAHYPSPAGKQMASVSAMARPRDAPASEARLVPVARATESHTRVCVCSTTATRFVEARAIDHFEAYGQIRLW